MKLSSNQISEVQIFGLKSSSDTRAAERFFKERRIKIHFVDLSERPISIGEINRFIQKFGLNTILNTESKAYQDANLTYLRVTDANMIERIILEPKLLKIPLVRTKNFLSIGRNETLWKNWLEPTNS